MNKTSLNAALALVFPALLVGCAKESPAEAAAPSLRPALVETVNAQVSASHHFYGAVRASNRAELSFQVGGRLIEMHVEEGDRVVAGQVLAKLDPKDAELTLASAQAELNRVRSDYQRALAIFEKSQAISVADLEEISTKVELAGLRVMEAQRAVNDTTLTAPFDGIIGDRLVDNHIQVAANQAAFVIHDLELLEVAINVPDRIVAAGGYQVNGVAEIAALPGRQFDVEMKSYTTTANEASQSYQVTFSFAELGDAVVLPGMAAKVIPFADGTQKAVTVPLTALVPDNLGNKFVWVVGEDNSVHQRTVSVGEISHNRVAVSPLEDGERVVIAGVSTLVEGLVIQPTEQI
ncbi:efflux RND transporter periplasmic adaptor subunit [Ferrimonas balearica]|uniref:efflux RND transporter periplasmic adaptor subunit n=1 Tax=Ferrimonas balearica TaxID=44012 RepID=UPI001C998B40|nr:efflux RND transporter periplasmic adaptor subunit [Ferrimonas balearica]MBY5991460.1 efflux RND transporter periplasmic adaptor subunit [Ferrimonas balearica]